MRASEPDARAAPRTAQAISAPAQPSVTICIASFNTCSATQLCIRSARQFAGYPCTMRVGDGGSTDGSLGALVELEHRGWLHLERAPNGRLHAEWLDHWRRKCETDLIVFVDSDVEFRRPGWLQRLVAMAMRDRSAIAYAEWLDEHLYTIHSRPARVVGRPAPWLLMIAPTQLTAVRTGFAEIHMEDSESGLVVAHDVGAVLHSEAVERGLQVSAMPRGYRRLYHHYGGLSWLPTTGGRGNKKLRDQRVVQRRLRLLTRAQESPNRLGRHVATVRLAPWSQQARDLMFRIIARLSRELRVARHRRAT